LTTGGDELSRTLRRLRDASGMSTRQAGSSLGWSQAKVSRLETGRNLSSPDDAVALARVYGADPETVARVAELAGEVKAFSRRAYLNPTAEAQKRLAAVEKSSARIRTYSPAVIPGVLQTADYMRAIFTAPGSKPRTPEQLAEAIELRLSRRAALGQDGQEFTLITTEGVLGWMATSPRVMIDQLERISGLDLPGVRVGIIPWGTRARVFPLHTWDVYDSRAVAVGTATATALLTNLREVAIYSALFDQLEHMAMFGEACREILTRAVHRYRELT